MEQESHISKTLLTSAHVVIILPGETKILLVGWETKHQVTALDNFVPLVMSGVNVVSRRRNQ